MALGKNGPKPCLDLGFVVKGRCSLLRCADPDRTWISSKYWGYFCRCASWSLAIYLHTLEMSLSLSLCLAFFLPFFEMVILPKQTFTQPEETWKNTSLPLAGWWFHPFLTLICTQFIFGIILRFHYWVEQARNPGHLWNFLIWVLDCTGDLLKRSSNTSCWFQPIWKILVKMGILPQIGVNIKHIWNHQVDYYIYGRILDHTSSSLDFVAKYRGH